MNMESYEKVFLGLGVVVLVIFMGAIFWSVTTQGLVLPAPYERIDPNAVKTTPPFDNPGITKTGENSYQVVMRAKIWAFEPNEIEVPAGSTVTFLITPEDVIHGFKIMRVPVNVMLIPGQVSKVEYTFREPGTYTITCHEYCGVGHQGMFGTITVTGESAMAPDGPAVPALAQAMGGAN